MLKTFFCYIISLENQTNIMNIMKKNNSTVSKMVFNILILNLIVEKYVLIYKFMKGVGSHILEITRFTGQGEQLHFA